MKVYTGQTLLDIAIQETGSIETVLEIAIYNKLSITDRLEPNQEIIIPQSLVKKIEVVAYYSKRKIKPATEEPLEPEKLTVLGFENYAIDFGNTLIKIK